MPAHGGRKCNSMAVLDLCFAEKGVCISTVSLWLLLVYTEASLRLKDLKSSYANLSHLFAAHWYSYGHVYLLKALGQLSNPPPHPCCTFSIGYPVVYLGFYATCYFTNIFKLRIQKAVQSDNDFHMHLLQHSLPPGLQVYSKTGSDGCSGESSDPLVPVGQLRIVRYRAGDEPDVRN